MLTINQAASGDISIPVQTVDGIESVRQRVVQRLQMFRGEYYLDTRQGVPYIDDILKHQYDENLARRVVTDAILSVEDVVSVSDVALNFNADTRTLSWTSNVQTIFGGITVEGSTLDNQ